MRDEYTYNLFDEAEIGQPPKTQPGALVIRTLTDERLSPRQRAFNRLTKRIAGLQRRVSGERDKCERLLADHFERVRPLEVAIAERDLDLARSLALCSDRLRFTKKQLRALRAVIVGLCDGAFAVISPDRETEALYDKWSGRSYREELAAQVLDFKLDVAEEVHRDFGIEIDIDLAGDDASPEAIARFMNGVTERLHASERPPPRPQRRRKKTAKQTENEERVKAQEALAAKTVRSVYLSLAKILHPDTVVDAAERAHREEYMKQATSAYRRGDLCTLLELEVQWAAHDGDRLSALDDETLDLCVHALKGQVAELERALQAHYFDPRYADIQGLTSLTERAAVERMNERAATLRAAIDVRMADVALVSHAARTSVVMDLVRDYLAQSQLDDKIESFTDALIERFGRPR